MPIYEYRCESCGHTLDALQKLADAPLKDCPECERPALKRLMSAPAFRLKGGGWYETDFKSDKEKKRNLADGGGKDGSNGGSGKDGPNGGSGKSGTEAAKGSEGSKGSGAKAGESGKSSESAKSAGSANGDAGKTGKTKESSSGSSTATA
jgi:putative FmdB family regulatory protein